MHFFSAGNARFLLILQAPAFRAFPLDILGPVNGLFIAKMMGLSALAGSLATCLVVKHLSFISAQTVHTQTDSAFSALEPALR